MEEFCPVNLIVGNISCRIACGNEVPSGNTDVHKAMKQMPLTFICFRLTGIVHSTYCIESNDSSVHGSRVDRSAYGLI
jgi:hypothetical protein